MSPWGVLYHKRPRVPCGPFAASVSFVSTAVTSGHCVCVCRSPQRCTCSATPRAKGINRLCETVAASKDESCPMKKWCAPLSFSFKFSLFLALSLPPSFPLFLAHTDTHIRNKHLLPPLLFTMYKNRKGHCTCLLWHGHYYCSCIPLSCRRSVAGVV